uniref:Uncharacterized protein n=1 Tax=Alexandrium andersonii TaxID=327968 RepID=A0A7S2BM22_9DINO
MAQGAMDRSNLYSKVKEAKVMIEGKEELVEIDPQRGPMEELLDGSKRVADLEVLMWPGGRLEPAYAQRYRSWVDRTATEQEILVNVVAKKNRSTKEKRKAGITQVSQVPDFLAKHFNSSGEMRGMAWEDWGSVQRDNFVFNIMNNFDQDPEEAAERQRAKAKEAKAKADEEAKARAAQGPPWMQQDWGWMPASADAGTYASK